MNSKKLWDLNSPESKCISDDVGKLSKKQEVAIAKSRGRRKSTCKWRGKWTSGKSTNLQVEGQALLQRPSQKQIWVCMLQGQVQVLAHLQVQVCRLEG